MTFDGLSSTTKDRLTSHREDYPDPMGDPRFHVGLCHPVSVNMRMLHGTSTLLLIPRRIKERTTLTRETAEREMELHPERHIRARKVCTAHDN